MNRAKRTFITAITGVLMVVIPAAAAQATTVKIAGSTTVQPLAQKIATAWHNVSHANNATVAGGGSSAGVACATGGTCDIGTSSRDKKTGEAGNWTPFAKDAISVIVNPYLSSHGVRNLTLDQVKGIFLGTIRNWHSVGGPNATILVYQRAATSGTESKFKELFLGNTSATICCNAPSEASNGLMRTVVAQHHFGIGFVSMYFDLTSTTVTGVSIDGVAPTLLNAKSGRYTFVRTLYRITQSAHPTGSVAAFIRYALSHHVQSTIVSSYWIPITT
jgi:phosphate transport system substrate-binding protein